jgi:putative ABC transport system permease protein
VLLLPPWTRAPLLAFRTPGVVLALLGAAAVLACASSSAALFLSSAGTAALHRTIVADCPDATYPTLQGWTDEPIPADVEQLAAASMRDAGLPQPYQVLRPAGSRDVLELRGPRANQEALAFYRADSTDHVTVLSRGPARGIWLPSVTAGRLGVRAGQRLTLRDGRTTVPVAGVYRDLWRDPVQPYWCSYTGLFAGDGEHIPAGLVLATDIGTYDTLLGVGRIVVSASWVAPIDPSRLSLSGARELTDKQTAAYRQFNGQPPEDLGAQLTGTGQLPIFANQAALVRTGLRGPVVPIAVGGTILALLLVGAAGSYWADRRMGEVRLLSARGVSPAGLAGKALLELAVPAVVGTVAGWALARWLVRELGPSPYLDASAPVQALLTAAVALAAGLALLALVAGLRCRAATERPVGARRSWPARVPWEIGLLAAAAGCYLALRHGRAVELTHGVAQVNLLVVAFPLLFMVGCAILAVRLLVLLLPAGMQLLGRRWPAWYLASRQLAGSRLVSVLLLTAASTPIAVGLYAAGLTGTSQYTLDAKARLFAGSDRSVDTLDPLRRTAATDAAGTVVTRYLYAKLAGQPAIVLAIDPDTFAGTAFWDARYADLPLASLLEEIRRPRADGRVPALLASTDAGPAAPPGSQQDVPLGLTTAKLTVVGSPRLFPGRRQPVPLLVVDRRLLGPVDPHAGTMNELWSRGDPVAAQAAVTAQDARIWAVTDRSTVFDAANFLGISWTFDYLTALAGLVVLIAVGGLLLYLETRQRSRAAAYALGRRMGLTRGTHVRCLLAELATVLVSAFTLGGGLAAAAVLLVYRRLDVDPARPPGPLLTVPIAPIIGAGVAVAVIAGLATAYAQRAADRTNIAEVLRLG